MIMKKFDFRGPLLASSFGIGSIILLASRYYETALTEFWFTMMEDISALFIVVGTGYLTYCAIKKKNPLTLK